MLIQCITFSKQVMVMLIQCPFLAVMLIQCITFKRKSPNVWCKRNERCQKPLTLWFEFFFLFAFKSRHRFQNFNVLIIEGIGTLWLLALKLPQNYCDNNHKTQRFDFFNECKLNDGACHFPIGILGQVWYLIVSIPDLCNLTYFVNFFFIIIIKFFGN